MQEPSNFPTSTALSIPPPPITGRVRPSLLGRGSTISCRAAEGQVMVRSWSGHVSRRCCILLRRCHYWPECRMPWDEHLGSAQILLCIVAHPSPEVVPTAIAGPRPMQSKRCVPWKRHGKTWQDHCLRFSLYFSKN